MSEQTADTTANATPAARGSETSSSFEEVVTHTPVRDVVPVIDVARRRM